MTFTATPEPANVPPRVRIDVDTGNPAASLTALTIMRDGKPIAEQPYVGGSATLAYDYEAPFGVPVTYTATGTYIPAGSPVWSESWGSLAAWSGSTASFSVAGGYAGASVNGATIRRTTGGTIEKVTVTGTGLAYFALDLLDAGGVRVARLSWGNSVGAMVLEGNAGQVFNLYTIGPAEIVISGGTVTAHAVDNSWTMSTTYTGTPTQVQLKADSATLTKIGPVAVTLVQAPSAYSDSDTATLDVDQAWLIHRSQPSLSLPINPPMDDTYGGVTYIEASSGESKSADANRTIFRPVGRARAVVVTSGPRQADEWTLVLGATTLAAKDAIRALTNDQTPLLMRSAPSLALDMPDGWYSVGDVTVRRVEVPVITVETLITLPLIPVDEPIVRQGALWTWGDVLTSYATWADVLAENDTWLDVLAGPAA